MKRGTRFAATILAAVLMTTPLFAQSKGGKESQAAGEGAPQITDPKEAAAYQAFANAKGADKKIAAGTKFMSDYPKSEAAPTVAEQVVSLEFQKQDWPAFYSASDKALAVAPDDPSILAITAWVIARNYKQGQTSPSLDQAETDAKHALEILPAYQKPAGITDDQFAQAKARLASQAHSALGLIYFRQQNPDQAAAQLEQVTDPDATDIYMLGASDAMLNKHADAAAQFKKCSAMPGPLQAPCTKNAGDEAAQAGGK